MTSPEVSLLSRDELVAVNRPEYDDLYTESERSWRDRARQFAAEEIEPRKAEIDAGGRCRGLLRELGKAGLMGTTLPASFGGHGLDQAHNALISEELSAVSPSLAAMRAVSDVFVTMPILRFGTSEQQSMWLPGTVDGTRSHSLAITEPGAGSDANAISTQARWRDGTWILDGVKHYISGAAENDAVLAYVATDDGAAPAHRLSAFMIPLDAPGVSVKPIPTTGLRGFSHARVEFDGVRLDPDALVGARGQGHEVMMYGLEPERIDIASRALGCARRAYEEAVAYASKREQFGRPLSRLQGVSHPLAEARTTLESIRLLVHRAVRLFDDGRGAGRESAMAKLAAAERGFAICDQAMQITGARGYASGSAVDIVFRDIRALRFGGGSDEIMRHVIQREEFMAR